MAKPSSTPAAARPTPKSASVGRRPRFTLEVLTEVRAATAYRYEAGMYPDGMSDRALAFVDGDGGLLNALDMAIVALGEQEGTRLPHVRDYVGV